MNLCIISSHKCLEYGALAHPGCLVLLKRGFQLLLCVRSHFQRCLVSIRSQKNKTPGWMEKTWWMQSCCVCPVQNVSSAAHRWSIIYTNMVLVGKLQRVLWWVNQWSEASPEQPLHDPHNVGGQCYGAPSRFVQPETPRPQETTSSLPSLWLAAAEQQACVTERAGRGCDLTCQVGAGQCSRMPVLVCSWSKVSFSLVEHEINWWKVGGVEDGGETGMI